MTITEILDKGSCVIRYIEGSRVGISFFPDSEPDEEYCHQIKAKYFPKYEIPLRVGEGFNLWVEKSGRKEVMVLEPLPRKRLTPENLQKIREEVRRTIYGT
jgi:hypothetical protein